jgi:hypothetical protein
MTVFDTDIKKLVRLLLPAFLRKPVLMALLDALVEPFHLLAARINSFRNNNLYRLAHSSQVCDIEGALNDRFDSNLHRIYITDGAYRNVHYIFLNIEQQKPIYLYTAAEIAAGTPQEYLYQQDETGFIAESFIVHIPTELQDKTDEIRALTEQYKLAGRTFLIKIE